ncbi:MAG: nuclear transport factor 2 family protein, partial [Phycisphaerales bacterium]
MKSLRYCFPGLAAAFCLLPLYLAASVLAANLLQAPKQGELTPAAARAAIDAMYKKWGRARVELDRETMDSILAPDFYVLLYGQRLSREKFLSDISQERSGFRLSRFDTDILTVRKTEKDWTVVISEKLEVTILGSDGEKQKACSLWVTRDGWRKERGKWLVTFSEAIGHENWEPG